MDFLEALLKPADQPKDILTFIDQRLREVVTNPPMTPESRVRPSSIYKFCPRAEAIRVERGITLQETIQGRLQRIFSAGRSFEKYLRDTVLGPAGLLVGAWQCLGCKAIQGKASPKGAVPRPKGCGCGAGADVLTYVEPQGYVDPTQESSNLGGSGDGFVLWDNELSLLEVKTANDERFKKVSRERFPGKEYNAQAQTYMKVFDLRRTLFWFHNKNNGDQLALWVVASSSVQAECVDKAQALKRYFRQGQFPNRLCDSRQCSRAKACPVVMPCFDETWPAQTSDLERKDP